MTTKVKITNLGPDEIVVIRTFDPAVVLKQGEEHEGYVHGGVIFRIGEHAKDNFSDEAPISQSKG